MLRRRFKARATGGCDVRLSGAERKLLRTLPREVESALAAVEEAAASREATQADPELPESLRRLFPVAYATDDEAERRYRELTRRELTEHHRKALEMLSSSAGAGELSEEETFEWLTALNDLRLVLGTVLGVTDHEGGLPSLASTQHVVYAYLTGLEEELVGVVSGSLPQPVPGADDAAPDDPWGEPLGGLRWDGTPIPAGPPGPPDDKV
jgi:hypothetical protein